jgi:hypothetical protein
MRSFSVIRSSIAHLLTIAIVIAPALLSVPVEAAKIEIFFTEGVTLEDRVTAKQAVATTVKFFETNIQSHLDSYVRMVLVKGDPAMASALKRHCVISTEKAKERAKIIQGRVCNKEDIDRILINVENLTKAELIIVVSHEIVHKFQEQESDSSYNIMWLTEGVADVFGAFVAERIGEEPVRRDRQITCLEVIRSKQKFPSLTVLHSNKEWSAASEKYRNVYSTAELAVFELVKLKSIKYKSLFQYFRYLKRYNNAQAFEMTFGMKLRDYENYFDQMLVEKL